jgi:NADH-quinone oxidoreductase subunit F
MCAANSSASASTLQAAVDQAYEARLIGKNNVHGWDFDVIVHHGAGAYICGEETAMLESLEGKKGQPRMKPPFPANVGPLWLPDDGEQCGVDRGRRHHHARGATWFNSIGRAQQCGHQAVLHLGPREQALRGRRSELGIPFRELIEKHAVACAAAGTICWRSSPAAPPCAWSRRADHRHADGFRLALEAALRPRHGGGDRDGQVDRSHPRHRRLAYFYKHESCGQCTPCREGTGWMWRVMTRMAEGRAEKREIDMLLDVTKQIEGHTICALGDAAAWPIQGLITHFRHVIEERIDQYAANPDHDGAARRIAAE